MYALRNLMGHCYVHFAFVFTLKLLIIVYVIVSRENAKLACITNQTRKPIGALSRTFSKDVNWSEMGTYI